MAGVFRFSNAVSDMTKIIQTYCSIYEHFYPTTSQGIYFGHREAYQFLASTGLASSLGAIGEEAIRRSEREDTSRDPLYNQHKMYSEIYRMLGWYEPGSMQTNFNLPEYGDYIAHSDSDTVAKLFAMNVLHIVSPNPLTNVRGGNILRPFPLILKLMGKLDGIISRDELILTVLACPNDRKENYIEDAAKRIRAIRSKGTTELRKEIVKLKAAVRVSSDDVLPNYTRFPIAALKWTNWVEGKKIKGIYPDKSVKFLEITKDGRNALDRVNAALDIRYEDLEHYSSEEKAAFVVWSNLFQLGKVGFNISEYSDVIDLLEQKAKAIFNDFHVKDYNELLFFGYQEAPRDILRIGNELIGE